MDLPRTRRPSLFWWIAFDFMNASYTLIVGSRAPATRVFTPPPGRGSAKRQAHQLQNRDKHPGSPFMVKNPLAYLKPGTVQALA